MTDPTTPLKVAIVGTAPTSRMMAPYGDDSWQIWACSMGNMNVLPRVNLWYEMHAFAEMLSPENRAHFEPYYAWLREKSDNGTFTVIVPEFNPILPKGLPYPRDEMVQLFGRNWFTSTVAYMLAIAISRGAQEIGLFGVDMAHGQEHYEAQRAGCVRFLEIAMERGIKVTVPDESSLLAATPMYGYWEGSPFGRRMNAMYQLVKSAHDTKVSQREVLAAEINYYKGVMEQLEYIRRTWVDGSETVLNLGDLPAAVAAAKAADEAARQAAASPLGESTAPSIAAVLEGGSFVPGQADAMRIPGLTPNGLDPHPLTEG